ncbi:MAG: helix-turn-helix domain containing protein [Deltaproteobacteria bacterium]|nr:helix-turn-helix domain containing protein [Deltaproteobacteria bacterium]
MSNAKHDSLRAHRSLNPHPERVVDPLFAEISFFDPHDLVQVKYEMLRREREDGLSVTEAAARFGLSRVTFYQAKGVFERDGLAGLVPKKRGPRAGHKITAEVLTFLAKERRRARHATYGALAKRLEEHFGITVHPRSIERALKKAEKGG